MECVFHIRYSLIIALCHLQVFLLNNHHWAYLLLDGCRTQFEFVYQFVICYAPLWTKSAVFIVLNCFFCVNSVIIFLNRNKIFYLFWGPFVNNFVLIRLNCIFYELTNLDLCFVLLCKFRNSNQYFMIYWLPSGSQMLAITYGSITG